MIHKYKPLINLLKIEGLQIAIQYNKLKLQRTSNCQLSSEELFDLIVDKYYFITDKCLICFKNKPRFINLHEGYDFVCEGCTRQFYNRNRYKYIIKLKERYINYQLKLLARKYNLLKDAITNEFGENNITWQEGIDQKFIKIYLEEPFNYCKVCDKPIKYKQKFCKEHRTTGKNITITYTNFNQYNENFEVVDELKAQRSCNFKCKRCGYIFRAFYRGKDHLLLCPKCDNIYVSNQEKEFRNFIEQTTEYDLEYNKHFITNDNGNYYELDVYIPELNLGIEFNGAYYHSELFKNKYSHYSKWLYFKYKHNIQIVAIWDFEYNNPIKWNIWQSKLSLLLKQKNNFILLNARECTIKQIPWSLAFNFLEQTHLDGSGRKTNLCYGLLFEDQLIQVLTLSRQFLGRYDKHVLEISRFATKPFFVVRGGFNKLLKYALNNINTSIYTRLITYSENRYSSGKTYYKFFKFENYIKPGFFYYNTSRKQIINRLYVVKNKELEKNLIRVYDYGKQKFSMCI